MPYYDDPSGLTRYDSPGIYYDNFSPPEESNKPMATIAVGLSDKTQAEIVQYGIDVHTALTGNANVTTPNPSLVALQTLITAAQTGISDYSAQKDTLTAKKAVRDAAIAALKAGLVSEASTVEIATGGDPVKIATTGFTVRANPTPIGVPAQVEELKVTEGDDEGELHASWKAVRGGVAYEIEASPDPITPTSWVSKELVTKTNANVNSFTSGTKMWLHIRAVGAAGAGPWSNPAVKIVP